MRIGIGYDIHRFQEGRPLVLGGLTLAGETGLGGHSDAAGRRLLAEVRAAVEEAGYRPVNVDATLIAERPKLAPHLARMSQAIGEALGLDATRGNVKATTNEGIGAIGRGEGIGAIAAAPLRETWRWTHDEMT